MDEDELKAMSDEIGSGLGLESDEGELDLENQGTDPALPTDPAPAATPAAPTVPADPTAVPVEGVQKVPAAAPGPNDPPGSWRTEAKAAWAALPQVVKDEFRKREQDASRFVQQTSEKVRVADAFEQAIGPYSNILRQNNIDPIGRSRELLEINFRLATGSQAEKLDILRQIAQQHGVDPSMLDPANAPYESPQEKALREHNRALEFRLQAEQTHRVRAIQQNLTTELDAFASNPENVHFNQVAGQMAALIQSNQAQNLQEAYEKAVWMVPEIREQLLQQQLQAQSTAQAAATRLGAARKATAVNLNRMQPEPVRQTPATVTPSLNRMEDTISAAYAELLQRKG